MSRPRLPKRSDSTLSAGPPSDAAAPDDKAINDVYRSVEELGSLEAAAKKLREIALQRAGAGEQDPEEADFMAAQVQNQDRPQQRRYEEDEDDLMYAQAKYQAHHDEDQDGDEGLNEVVHLQEVVEGLWIGDLVAAMDVPGLEERGITNILSLLRPRLAFAPQFSVYPLEIDDSADTDILTHLPSCVAWIQECLERRRRSLDPAAAMSPMPPRDTRIDRIAGETTPGGVLVHCQAGMSRSATVVVAYLMRIMDLEPVDALEMLREKRPVVDPSDTFWYQLALFYNADGKVSLRDRSTRQFYMERTTSQFMNGEVGAPPMDKMAKYPATPSPSNPPTPMGGHGRRKIRCKMCRRHLAVREHMMDHILDQSPVSRPRTPSNFALPSPRMSFSNISGFTSTTNPSTSNGDRRPSVVSEVINPLTGLPGASRSRHASMSSAIPSPSSASFPDIQEMKNGESEQNGNGHSRQSSEQLAVAGGVPLPRTTTPGLILTASSPETALPPRLITDNLPGRTELTASPAPTSRSQSTEPPARTFRSAEELSSRLPPHLLALRNAGGSSSALSSPFNVSPTSSPEKETTPQIPHHSFPPQTVPGGAAANGGRSRSQSAVSNSGATVGRRRSLLAMTPADGQPRERRASGFEGSIPTGGPPILVNPKCSGYFVEPLTWMEPFLANGDISGKIVCPNEKCGAKIGNFDWAGVQCGCKEWVTPGFCISRSKVDEVW